MTKRNKWCYSLGCTGRDMAFTLVSMFLITYIQYTIKLTTAQFAVISAVIIIARVWDAINDPMMGTIIENSSSKGGKYRPFILWGAVVNAIFTIGLFTIRPSGWGFVGFFSVIYILWGMSFTVNDISYWSLMPALTKDAKERSSITNFTVIFASVGQFVAAGLIPILTTGNAVSMYAILAFAITICFVGCQLLTYLGVKEEYRPAPKNKITLKKMFQIILNNKQLKVMALVILFYQVASGLLISFGLNFFYFTFGYGGEEMFLFTIMYAVGTLGSQLLYPLFNKFFNRKKISVIGIVIALVGYLVLLGFGYVLPESQLILNASGVLIFFGQGLFYVAIIIMLQNTVEYNEVLTGERNEGIVFAIRPFMVKLSSAIQQGVVSLILVVSGLFTLSQKITDLEIEKGLGVISDITGQANQIISEATGGMLFTLRLGMIVVPVISLVLAIFLVCKKYIITEEKYEEILKELEERQVKTENLEG